MTFDQLHHPGFISYLPTNLFLSPSRSNHFQICDKVSNSGCFAQSFTCHPNKLRKLSGHRVISISTCCLDGQEHHEPEREHGQEHGQEQEQEQEQEQNEAAASNPNPIPSGIPIPSFKFDPESDTNAFGRDPRKETEFWMESARDVLASAEVKDAIEKFKDENPDNLTDEQRAYNDFIKKLDEESSSSSSSSS